MGLLDEAIRDHLELKRRRGADPTEIARAEHEALEPVFPGEPPTGSEPEQGVGNPGPADAPAAPPSGEALAEPSLYDDAVAHEVPVDPAFSTLGQETAELDMEPYVGEQPAPPAQAAPGENGAVAEQPLAAAQAGEELIEWEDASRPVLEPPPEQIPGQERLSLE